MTPAVRFLACALAAALLGAPAPRAAQDPQPGPDGPGDPVRHPLPTAEEIAQLPPDGGPEFNRLVFEQSPYLLQHARNPVDWYPWGEEAFARAAQEDKPIFLSIGYSTCHWCHVMEHESFEDAEVAALMNEHFVCIKVDREERPDVDNVYMTVVQAMTGRGGWPMTVVLTPDKRPFFGGTYYPKDGRGQRPGMLQLVPALSEAWKTQREGVLESAQRITEHVAQLSGGAPGEALDATHLATATRQLAQRFDPVHAGFGMAPKFPVPHNLRHLLRDHARTGDGKALEMALETLRQMARGGIWDHVGHGFHRYSTDREWLVPHFEKMLYDQALLCMAYVEAWQVSGDPELRATAERILEYVLRDMTDPAGGFYSAEDADSEGEEGLFYVWTLEELGQVLSDADLQLATVAWGLTAEGNFRDEATGVRTGRNIPHLPEPLPRLAERLNLDEGELRTRLEAIRRQLFPLREQRVHPLKDDKVLTDWNGLMIAALATAGRAFDEPRYLEAATRAADFVARELVTEDGRLLKRWRQGQAAHLGMLEDHAFLAWGLVELYESTGDPRHLSEALRVVDVALAHFWDAEGGGFYLTPDDGEALFVRAKEVYDGALPSGNSVMAFALARLARLTGRVELEDRAWDVVRAFAGQVGTSPSQFTQLCLALDLLVGPTSEVVVVGDPEAEDTRAMLRALERAFLPRKVVVRRGAGEDPGPIGALAPFVAEQRALDGRATAYVCRDFTCAAPTHDVEAVLAALRERPAPVEPADAEASGATDAGDGEDD